MDTELLQCKIIIDNHCAVHIYILQCNIEMKTDRVLAEFERLEMKECKL